MSNDKRINARIPEQLKERLDRKAHEQGKKLSQVMREALEEWAERQERNGKDE